MYMYHYQVTARGGGLCVEGRRKEDENHNLNNGYYKGTVINYGKGGVTK